MLSNFAASDLKAMPSLARGEVRAHRVPLALAAEQTLRGYGHIVPEFASGRVTIVTWPQPNWRPIVPGTGNEGGVVEDSFVMQRHGEIQHAHNRAVGRSYITGWFADPATASAGRRPGGRYEADLSARGELPSRRRPDLLASGWCSLRGAARQSRR
jgi:ureidoglycolate lyase